MIDRMRSSFAIAALLGLFAASPALAATSQPGGSDGHAGPPTSEIEDAPNIPNTTVFDPRDGQ